MHRDSVGVQQAIQPDEVNWMIAGRGITHSERFEKARAEGGPLHGIQAWVALPKEHEETRAFVRATSAPRRCPCTKTDGVRTRLLAGAAFGLTAGVTTHSPLFYAHWELAAGARAALPDEYSERALYIAAGEIEARGQPLRRRQDAGVRPGRRHLDHGAARRPP